MISNLINEITCWRRKKIVKTTSVFHSTSVSRKHLDKWHLHATWKWRLNTYEIMQGIWNYYHNQGLCYKSTRIKITNGGYNSFLVFSYKHHLDRIWHYSHDLICMRIIFSFLWIMFPHWLHYLKSDGMCKVFIDEFFIHTSMRKKP